MVSYASFESIPCFVTLEMDFEGESDGDNGMMPILPVDSYAEEINYPSTGNMAGANGFKSVSAAKLTPEQRAALEDPQEKDILELLNMMDDFEPIVGSFYYEYFLISFSRFLRL